MQNCCRCHPSWSAFKCCARKFMIHTVKEYHVIKRNSEMGIINLGCKLKTINLFEEVQFFLPLSPFTVLIRIV